jgi:hypothetical protein
MTALAAPQAAARVALLEFRPFVRGTLRGFCKIRIGKSLVINDVSVHTSHGKHWASLPGKPLLSGDGTALRDAEGKIRYVPMLEWSSRDARDAFSAAVVEAVRAEHPGAFAEGAPA